MISPSIAVPSITQEETIRTHRLRLIEALESGKYLQTRHLLRKAGDLGTIYGYCAVGVGLLLADYFESDAQILEWSSVFNKYYDADVYTISEITEMNDRMKSFPQIAAALREKWNLL